MIVRVLCLAELNLLRPTTHPCLHSLNKTTTQTQQEAAANLCSASSAAKAKTLDSIHYVGMFAVSVDTGPTLIVAVGSKECNELQAQANGIWNVRDQTDSRSLRRYLTTALYSRNCRRGTVEASKDLSVGDRWPNPLRCQFR